MTAPDVHPPVEQSRIPDLAPWVALIAVGGALGLIPIAHTPSRTYLLAFALISITSLVIARFDQRDRWTSIALWPALLLVGVFACSVVASDLSSILLNRFWTMPVLALVMPVVQIACWRPSTRSGVLILVYVTVLICALDLIIQRSTGWSLGGQVIQGRGNVFQSGSLGNPNDLASMVVLLPLAVIAVPKGRSVRGVLLILVILASTGVAALWTKSRQVLLGWVLSILFTAARGLLRANRQNLHTELIKSAAFCLVILVLILFAVFFVEGLWFSALTQFMRAESFFQEGLDSMRVSQFRFAWTLFTDSPWLGIGLGGFGEYWALGVSSGWSWEGETLPPVIMPWVHSLPLEILCETGVVGAAAFVICILDAIRRCWGGLRTEGEGRALSLAVLAGWLIFLLIGIIDLSFIKDWVRIIFWLLVGLSAATSQKISN